MKNNKIITSVIICVAIAGLSFWGGMSYRKSKSVGTSASRTQQENFAGRTGPSSTQGARNNTGGGLVSGEIMSKDDTSITVKLQDGGSKIIFFAPSIKVEKSVDGLLSDMAIGKQVVVVGVANPDGSVNAQSVSIRTAVPSVIQKN